MTFAVIIPAAGSGSRSGSAVPKQYVEILGAPVLEHTINAFLAVPGCTQIIVAIDVRWRDRAEHCAPSGVPLTIVAGGAERQDSIAAALGHVGSDTEIVLVHDAARPCASRELIERVIEATQRYGAAVPALPINETVKRVDAGGRVVETIDRTTLRAAQTPQGFRRTLLERAYAAARQRGRAATDDAMLVEALGEPVVVVEGEWSNLKITHEADFGRAEEVLRSRRLD